MSHHEPTIASILRRLAGEFDGPVEERLVLDRVLEQRPSSAKNPYATIRERLRGDELRLGWLRLGRGRLMPLHVILTGLRFRCVPSAPDLDAGLLPVALLQPFAGGRAFEQPGPDRRRPLCVLRDAGGALMPVVAQGDARSPDDALPAFDLADWYERTGFRPGDSVLVTIASAEPLVLLIDREPRAAFRAEAVAPQDAELIEAIVERVYGASTPLVPCDELLLAIFAAAPWRAAYPGTPWQQLVAQDGRLQLVDEIFLARHHLATRAEATQDAALLGEIEALQAELRRARQRDAEAGLWSGQIQRASATFGAFEHDLARHPLFGRLDELGGGDWSVDEDWDPGDPLAEDEIDPADPATLNAARDRMLELLPPETIARLEVARPEEAELIIASNLNMLLARAPELFPRVDLIPPDDDEPAGAEPGFGDDWQEAWDDEDELDDLGDDLGGEETGDAFARSGDLIAQFYDYLLEMGKSEATARVRARALDIYADFLASYYSRSLAEGDYATLDECLFYYYPRQVMHTSARQVREICTAIKQLYAFLKQRGIIGDDRFAEALWRRRDQAARVVTIYERISGDSPSFELLFERLFQPYTE
jgi:hypothetical protein